MSQDRGPIGITKMTVKYMEVCTCTHREEGVCKGLIVIKRNNIPTGWY